MIFDYWPSVLASRYPDIAYLIGKATKKEKAELGIHASFAIDEHLFRQCVG